MTQFTSFVAVEEMTVTDGGAPRRIDVPVEMPEGVSHEGVFGEDKQFDRLQQFAQLTRQKQGSLSSNLSYAYAAPVQTVGGVAGAVHGQASPSPAPPPPPVAAPKAATTPAKLAPNDEESVDVSKPDQRSKDRRALESKLQPAVLAALDCFRKAANATASCANTHGGKIAVEIWLTADSSSTREQLRALGFEITQDHKAQKMLSGNLALDKLEALTKLGAIQFVSLERR